MAACAFFYIKQNVLAPIPTLRGPSDFAVYYQAAKDILRGTSPYETSAYFYPPSVAFLMAPFGLIPYVTARWIWFLLSHALFLSSGWLLWRAAGRGRIAFCCIACVWALGGAAGETFGVGQLSFLLVLALAVAFTQGTQLSGIAVGIGCALKYFPGVLAMAFVFQRNWRALRTAIAVVVLAIGIPWLSIACAFAGPKAPGSAGYWMGTPSMFSWSIPSVVLRLLDPLRGSGSLPSEWEFGNVAASLHLSARLRSFSAGTALIVLAAGVIALTIVCRGRLRRAQAPWAMIGLLSLSLAAAPVCWSHYQVLQYPGVALMLVTAIRLRVWRIAAAVAVLFAFAYQFPQLALCAYHDKYAAWSAASPATLYFWSSVAPLASLGLFGLALWNIKRSGLKSDRKPHRSLTSDSWNRDSIPVAALTSVVVLAKSIGLRTAPFTASGSSSTNAVETAVATRAVSVCNCESSLVTSTVSPAVPTCSSTSRETVSPAASWIPSWMNVLNPDSPRAIGNSPPAATES